MDAYRCPGCFKMNKEGTEACPCCGYIRDTPAKEPFQLKPGTVLNERYLVGRAVSSDSIFQIYSAFDEIENKKVAVWELLPLHVFKRGESGKPVFKDDAGKTEFQSACDGFLKGCLNIGKMDVIRGILTPLNGFMEGTAYIVTEAIAGDTLEYYLNSVGGKLGKKEVFAIMLPILKSFAELHKNKIAHGNIGLSSMYFTENGKIKLGGFLGDCVKSFDKTKSSSIPEDVRSAGMALFILLTGNTEALNKKDDSIEARAERLMSCGLNKNEAAAVTRAIECNKEGMYSALKLYSDIEKAEKDEREASEQGVKTIALKKKHGVSLLGIGISLVLMGLIIIGILLFTGKAMTGDEQGTEIGYGAFEIIAEKD